MSSDRRHLSCTYPWRRSRNSYESWEFLEWKWETFETSHRGKQLFVLHYAHITHHSMKLVSWNVNGIRANLWHGFLWYLESENPDIIGLQEVKATLDQCPAQLDFEEMGYSVHWNSANKKWYSGTAVLSKVTPISVTYWLGLPEHDEEGRVITLEYDDFYFVNVYTPNSKRELERLDYRQLWDSLFLDYLRRLEMNRPVIFCGDLNVAHKPIDLAHPKANEHNAGYTQEERNGFQSYIDAGFIDTFRHFYPDTENAYTWWSNFSWARAKNVGWRIDYFLVSQSLKDRLLAASIQPEIFGSDHCPIRLEIEK